MSDTVSEQVFYSGKVQGVGFRYTVKQASTGYEVVGWVRNLPDGRVELHVNGERDEVESFLKHIAEGQLASYIRQVERVPLDGSGEKCARFEIRH